MGAEIELVSDGEGLAIVGAATDVDRFLLASGLDKVPSKGLDLHRIWSLSSTAGAAAGVAADIAMNSGRWVKLTAESAEAVRKFGLMPTKTAGVSHAMIGNPGDVKQWLQVAQAPTALLSGPFALTALSTMMQQRAMQQQMDEIVDYLREITEKVDDILRNQQDAVLADVIGVDLVIEDALTVRDQVGHVSEVTWSKVQGAALPIARTQGYAIRQLDGIAERLARNADPGKIARATQESEPRVAEWLAVIARTFQLQEGLAVLELDRVRDASPELLDAHRVGLTAARRHRRDVIARSTSALLARMDATVRAANSKVLFNPIDSPAAVLSSNRVTSGVLDFHRRLGIESGHEVGDAKRWGRAAGEVVDEMRATGGRGAAAVRRAGEDALGLVTETVRSVDLDAAPDLARAAGRRARTGVAGATGRLTGALGGPFRQKGGAASGTGAGSAPDERAGAGSPDADDSLEVPGV
ncbi:MAG: hypothetical protein IR158_04980 [Cellulomonas sp.]|uniref:hypothetical protein n=1 Tax=Cellulomonas sp. TaxID=40001 RepID=UPI0019E0BA0D|nr:hypothetical protein [Cellulomonas sp.]MBF0687107.1 hypothetical protein [Cellulomonas sp.]